MTKTCKICGSSFKTDNKRRLVCSDACKKENNRRNNHIRYQEGCKTNFVTKKQNSSKNIINLAAEAREHGMTYGQYVAKLYLKGVR